MIKKAPNSGAFFWALFIKTSVQINKKGTSIEVPFIYQDSFILKGDLTCPPVIPIPCWLIIIVLRFGGFNLKVMTKRHLTNKR